MLTKHEHLVYDPFDRLIGRYIDSSGSGVFDHTELYVYDGSDIVLQFDGAGSLTNRYLNVFGQVFAEDDVSSLTSQGLVTWPLTDAQGSVHDVVDVNGALADHIILTAFGQTWFESNAGVHHLQGFAAGLPDPVTGEINYLHRWLDPVTGRWQSQDPIGTRGGDANFSRYVGNDPTNATDPSGLAKRENVKIDKTWTFGVDRGSEVHGGFEIHVYRNGKEVAKIMGDGSWCKNHGGKELPYKPKEFRKQFSEAHRALRKQLRVEVSRASKAGWSPKPGIPRARAIGSALTIFALLSQTACSLDAVATGSGYRKLMSALKNDNIEAADKAADDLYFELLAAHDSHAALQWKGVWDDLKKQHSDAIRDAQASGE